MMRRIIRMAGWLVATAVAAYGLLLGYATFGIDGAQELKRGTILGELLLTSGPIRSFPASLIDGEKRYFYCNGEPSGRSANTLVIRVSEYDPAMMQRCVDWLAKCGFARHDTNTAGTLTRMQADDQREAWVEFKDGDVVMTVQH
ncbi:hypothetical protein [Prosthecobacter sp.]|uniref:hypothetical protein n=1 Tax=Prosthecobacter sp. TaxID=1965333 RepID=UPI0037841D0D